MHVGKKLRCKCGRTLVIARPAEEKAPAAQSVAGARKRVRGQTVPVVLRAWARDALAQLRSRSAVVRWTSRLSWACLAFVAVTWLLLITTSESFLPATLLAYGPRWVLLIPGIALAPFALVAVRRALVPLALASVIVVGPIMGGRVSWRTFGRSIPLPTPSESVRVLTFNADGGDLVAVRLRATIAQLQPQLIAFQECGQALWDSLQAIPNWHYHRHANLCTASRWPIQSFDSMPRAAFARVSALGFGGTALVARYVIASPHGAFAFVNLHLETARKGLEGLMGSSGFVPERIEDIGRADAILNRYDSRRIALNARIRDMESERASVWSAANGEAASAIIVGDFNLPVESAIFRRHWRRFADAFEATGSGFGWSKHEGALLRIRIDHILSNTSAPRAIGAWLGPDLGSDHLPVIADLAWRHP